MLTFFHLYANYRAVKTLRLKTFNDKRMAIFYNEIAKKHPDFEPNVDLVNDKEQILAPSHGYRGDVRIGVSLEELFPL